MLVQGWKESQIFQNSAKIFIGKEIKKSTERINTKFILRLAFDLNIDSILNNNHITFHIFNLMDKEHNQKPHSPQI